jgi:hypothetical protein
MKLFKTLQWNYLCFNYILVWKHLPLFLKVYGPFKFSLILLYAKTALSLSLSVIYMYAYIHIYIYICKEYICLQIILKLLILGQCLYIGCSQVFFTSKVHLLAMLPNEVLYSVIHGYLNLIFKAIHIRIWGTIIGWFPKLFHLVMKVQCFHLFCNRLKPSWNF